MDGCLHLASFKKKLTGQNPALTHCVLCTVHSNDVSFVKISAYILITHTQPFYGSVDFVRDNPGEPVPEETFTHSHSSWSSIIPICFLHLLRSMASSLFNPRALQSFSTISVQVFFGLPLGLAPSTSFSIHFFTQSLSSFRNTCPYHCNLFRCSTEIM